MGNLRLFAWVRVLSVTGKSRRRRVTVSKAGTPEELALRFTVNVGKFVTDPTIKAMVLDVRTPPSPEDNDLLPDEDDVGEDDFAWQHDTKLTERVVSLLQEFYPKLPITIGLVV